MKSCLRSILMVAAALLFVDCAHAQVLVIGNPGFKVDSVSKSDLREVFTGSSTSVKEAGHVVPALLKEGSAHNQFLSEIVGQSPVGLLICWRGLVLSGRAAMPKTFDSESAMVEYVARTPGAIGYISPGTPHDSVKVLTVR
jgi:ABC-type phosphate transport system substrate-binding protein